MEKQFIDFKDTHGTLGGKTKGKNQIKLDNQARRQEVKGEVTNLMDVEFPIPQDFGDGSLIEFCWTSTHKHLLQKILDQKRDDCWALTLVKILEFFYNKDITKVAEQKTLAIDSLIKHVILGNKDANDKKLDKRSLAVPSLNRAIDYIRDTGIERDYGTKTYKIKANVITNNKANPEDILPLLHGHGPIGLSVDMEGIFLKNEPFKEIYILREPKENKERHAVIIVGYGTTKDGKRFFIIQNTWGTNWGLHGYARIIIKKTCPIFYVESLVGRQK